MKDNILIFVVIIILTLNIIAIFIPPSERKQLKEVTKELKILKFQLDSAHVALDGLSYRYQRMGDTLKMAKNERLKATQETNKYKKRYEEIRFVSFANDSLRSSEISKLYSSYRHR